MNWISNSMKWIMLVSGGLTCTMFYAAIAPQRALQSTFGESIDGPVANIVVRNWGVLIALMGGMLIYGAFNSSVRFLVLTVAGLSKIAFITLLLIAGRQFLDSQAGIAIVSDLIQVTAFALYMIAVRRTTGSTLRSHSAAAEIGGGRPR
jgi:hypothetical protein